jgi:hypothetical protein
VVVILCALAAGCGGGSDEDPDEVPAIGQGSVVAGCRDAVGGNGDPNWRARATDVGRFGFFGVSRDFRNAQKVPRDSVGASHPLPASGPILLTKLPLVVEGTKPIDVAVAPEDRAGAGIVVAGEGGPYAEVRLVPCRDQARTGWPAGWVLRDREPVTVLVRDESQPATELVVGGPIGSGG